MFRPCQGTPIADITDGASNTMAVTEYLKGVDRQGRPWRFLHKSGWLPNPICQAGPNSTASDDLIGYDSHFCPTDNSRNDPSADLPLHARR